MITFLHDEWVLLMVLFLVVVFDVVWKGPVRQVLRCGAGPLLQVCMARRPVCSRQKWWLPAGLHSLADLHPNHHLHHLAGCVRHRSHWLWCGGGVSAGKWMSVFSRWSQSVCQSINFVFPWHSLHCSTNRNISGAWFLYGAIDLNMYINSLWSNDAIWRHRSGSTLAPAMACCLTAPSHYLNQCWLIIQWDPATFIWWQFHKRYISHQSN